MLRIGQVEVADLVDGQSTVDRGGGDVDSLGDLAAEPADEPGLAAVQPCNYKPPRSPTSTQPAPGPDRRELHRRPKLAEDLSKILDTAQDPVALLRAGHEWSQQFAGRLYQCGAGLRLAVPGGRVGVAGKEAVADVGDEPVSG
jgi:hypothetical protein